MTAWTKPVFKNGRVDAPYSPLNETTLNQAMTALDELFNGGSLTAGLTGATAATRYVGGTTSGAPVAGTFVVGDFVIDRTGQVYICIVAGTPGTWTCATKTRAQLAMSAAGALIETGNPGLYGSATAPATQVVYGTLLGLHAGDIVTGVALRNQVAAAGTLPTTARFGIADATGKILALSGNDNALALWGVGANPHAFTAPYTVLTDGGYFACYVVNGTWGTTQPTPLRGSLQTAGFAALGSNTSPLFSWFGQTDLPAVNSNLTITSTANAIGYYVAFY